MCATLPGSRSRCTLGEGSQSERVLVDLEREGVTITIEDREGRDTPYNKATFGLKTEGRLRSITIEDRGA